MRSKPMLGQAIDYRDFENPYTGLAAMIFVQAANDLLFLRGKDYRIQDGIKISQSEIRRFFSSEWASFMAESLKLDTRDTVRFSEQMGTTA